MRCGSPASPSTEALQLRPSPRTVLYTARMIWRPDLTVAAIVQRADRFLLVEETIRNLPVLNQPAGHVEDGESILAAVIRETLEETAWHFVPRHFLGVYLWRNELNGQTIVRVAISGDVTSCDATRALDDGIITTHWMSRDEMLAQSARLRSPLVLRCVDDHLAGRRHDLSALQHIESSPIARTG
jgi:8-oxo-dGTP pyrophosphatase MutT (NUDIX family)